MRIEIKREPNTWLIALMTMWLILFIAGSILISIDYFFYDVNFDSIIFAGYLIFILAAIIVVRQLLWQLQGKEIVEISDGKLLLYKEGIFWAQPKTFELDYVDKFRYEKNDETTFFLKKYGLSGGKIIFNYMDLPKQFGQTVTESEARSIINQIEKHLVAENNQKHY